MQINEAFRKIDECIMSDAEPSARLRSFAGQPWFKTFPFSMILEEQNTSQSPVHHPEGNVWEHTLMVVDEAAIRKSCSTNPRAFMWAALLHEIGKPETTKVREGKITAYNHDRKGAELAHEFLCPLTDDADLIENIVWLIRYHMQILFVTKALPFMDIPGMAKHADVLDVALLGYCDRLGRKGVDPDAERNTVLLFLQKCHIGTLPPWL
ncbi:MAG: HDIG domain-containing protein [Clostridia bacterium]|nr:HDIG domain-containing protein [Clostridia bacterium]NCC68513.1 HDIG domain-containing protein [Clostridia bacterium]